MKKNINSPNMITKINQLIKIDSLDQQVGKMVNDIDDCYSKNNHSKLVGKISHKQQGIKKNRNLFIRFLLLFSFCFGVCATIAVYYCLIESNIIRKKHIRLDYEIKKDKNNPDDAGRIHITPVVF